MHGITPPKMVKFMAYGVGVARLFAMMVNNGINDQLLIGISSNKKT